ncbi:MAG: primosomal protein N' [Gemmatimonadota bacterium]
MSGNSGIQTQVGQDTAAAARTGRQRVAQGGLTSGAAELYCHVALPRPVRQTFAYRLPPALAASARPGMRVVVPFGHGRLVGCIDRLADRPGRGETRDVLDLLDPEPILSEPLLELCRWLADYYVAPPGMVLRAALPPGLFSESALRIELLDRPARPENLTTTEGRILERLERAAGPLRAATLRRELGLTAIGPTLRKMVERGLISVDEEPPQPEARPLRRQVVRLTRSLPTLLAREKAFGRARRQRDAYETLEALGGESTVSHMERQLGFSRAVLAGLVERGVAELREETVGRDPFAEGAPSMEPGPAPIPTPRQAEVTLALREQADSSDPGVALLRGVTGSGKTLVYLELLDGLLECGRSAIVLVPEISLTPQTVSRFRARFGEAAALLHSGLSDGERYDEWRALRSGRKRLVVGTRSAVFAPVRELGAIILDEEHDGSYKQSETPRYHARAVAAMRCRLEGALCLLGSATPSLESWAHSLAGRYRLYELPDRVTGQPLPRVELVDMRDEREALAAGAPGGGVTEGATAFPVVLSARLRSALAARLARGEQTILLLNRRGFSTFLQCPACGKVWSCRRCNVSLTHHRRPPRLLCHHCAFETAVPERCDECGAEDVSFTGLGTEQVEARIGEEFPDARVARMDVDTTRRKDSHRMILERVRQGKIDILLGTQMIAKGLDFPEVTLVGVINADVGLNLPDFRASERTFQLLAQVAGRAGRGREPGEVLVQTSRPGHAALRTAAAQDFVGFAELELAERREAGYPPYRRLANLVVSGRSEEAVAEAALRAADWTHGLIEDRRLVGIDLLGPAPCPIDRLRGRYRWHFLLKADRAAVLGTVLRYLARELGRPVGGLRLEIDRDPEALL